MARNKQTFVRQSLVSGETPSFEAATARDMKEFGRDNIDFSGLDRAHAELARSRAEQTPRKLGLVAIGSGEHVKLIDASEVYVVPVRTRTGAPMHRADGEPQ